MMWSLLGYKKKDGSSSSSSRRKQAAAAAAAGVVYAVTLGAQVQSGSPPQAGVKDAVSLHATARHAVVHASKLELVGGKPHAVVAVLVVPACEAGKQQQQQDLSERLSLDQLPELVRAEVEAQRELDARRAQERAERVRRVAEAIKEPWRALVDDFRAKAHKCAAAKEAAAKSYVKDKGMSAARVREICDANDMALVMSRDALKDRGERLVRSAVDQTDAFAVSLDEVVRVGELEAFP